MAAPGQRPPHLRGVDTRPQRPSLAVIVSTAPERGDLARALELARAAREADIEVGLFFMHEAVRGLPAQRRALDALRELDCELRVCATSAEACGLDEDALGVALGSQDDHAALVHRSARVLAFT
ncbi:DsrE family protein [Haliangium ochraceum]|uniref:DsrE family protein n=1 Tax=Haliangium ochraceum (strain DSM 14365 / JCM 11303 / SMP-2) TaxID=502025 RepID=D0LKV9_HALO1|nr:DsrE family protein [Haliangium ochraceum]ACY16679.1 DsrE family protein [Haliangium ochraceum DSM 14365]